MFILHLKRRNSYFLYQFSYKLQKAFQLKVADHQSSFISCVCGSIFFPACKHSYLLLTPASGMIMAVGQEMMMMHTMKQPMPVLVKDDASDPPKIKTIKQMIKRMTVFEPKERLSMKEVDQALKGLQGR